MGVETSEGWPILPAFCGEMKSSGSLKSIQSLCIYEARGN